MKITYKIKFDVLTNTDSDDDTNINKIQIQPPPPIIIPGRATKLDLNKTTKHHTQFPRYVHKI